MSTRRKDEYQAEAAKASPRASGIPTAAYEGAVKEFGAAIELLRRGEFAPARDLFERIDRSSGDEHELAERARVYTRICERKLAPRPAAPRTAEERYFQAVVLSNNGRSDEAIQLLNQALQDDPGSVRCLYARSCAQALKGSAERAVADLRQAIAIDPRLRFQAINDPDFERIREEPSFIDIIEPTPTGA